MASPLWRPNGTQNTVVTGYSTLQDREEPGTDAKDFNSQEDPWFQEVSTQDDEKRTNVEPPAKDFDSQDDPFFLEVYTPQHPTCCVVPALDGASTGSSFHGMTSSVATSNQHWPPLRQTGEESKTKKHSASPTSSSVRKHPHQTPSYPVRIAKENVYLPGHVPYSWTELKNMGASSGKELSPVRQPRVSCNESDSTSSSSAVEVRVLPLNVLNYQVISGCSVADKTIGYQIHTSPTVAENNMIEKAKGRYEDTPKHIKHHSKTATSNERVVLPSRTEERNCQSLKTLDGRQDRYRSSKSTPKYQSKTDASENLTGNDAQLQTDYDESVKNLIPSHHRQKSKDAGAKATHAKRILVNSKEEGKEEERLCESASQPTKRPRKGKKDLEKYMNAELVYFDLETGGFSTGVDILQIAAVSNEHSFMQYVTPTKPIHPKAEEVTGLKNENGTLMKRTSANPLTWEPLETLPVGRALQKFLEWLEAIGPCLLAAHNAPFDKRHLLYHVHESGMHEEFQKSVRGFVNTLPFFRKTLPEFKTQGLKYKQEVLVEHLLGEGYDAHDALEDAKFLQKLVKKVNAPKPDLVEHVSPF
ncbi:uncharacterized protein [Macrobrachium rosenbergii]|uniref:uncharacterized protein isoform X2 n=1 Tax=Macrobrachium rosenbergii TaxID=79674 RepID=UPI0034D4F588